MCSPPSIAIRCARPKPAPNTSFIAPSPHAREQWRQIVVAISVLSTALGAVAAIGQTNIKRLLAYSSIGHVGYALIGLAAATPNGIRGVLVYMAIYLFMNLGTMTVILCMRQNGQN